MYFCRNDFIFTTEVRETLSVRSKGALNLRFTQATWMGREAEFLCVARQISMVVSNQFGSWMMVQVLGIA